MNAATRSAVTGLLAVLILGTGPRLVRAQDSAPATRAEAIEQEKARKSTELKPYEPNKVEEWIDRAEDLMLSGRLHWHPFFQNAYSLSRSAASMDGVHSLSLTQFARRSSTALQKPTARPAA